MGMLTVQTMLQKGVVVLSFLLSTFQGFYLSSLTEISWLSLKCPSSTVTLAV